jgi:hypothetical protein
MKKLLFPPMIIVLMILSACGSQDPSCPVVIGTPHYLTVPPEALPTPTPGSAPAPILMEIGSKTILVDKVVEGPLCNDTWSGTVYVTCDVQIYFWEEEPTFLKNCNLSIEPGTIVYVEYHHNNSYYEGCSCHFGE